MQGRLKTIKGLVIPSKWDQKGTITGVLIAGVDEEEYTIEDGPMTEEMLSHLHREIELTGRVVRPGHSSHLVRIEKYRVIS